MLLHVSCCHNLLLLLYHFAEYLWVLIHLLKVKIIISSLNKSIAPQSTYLHSITSYDLNAVLFTSLLAEIDLHF